MLEWTMTHPWMTFFLAALAILAIWGISEIVINAVVKITTVRAIQRLAEVTDVTIRGTDVIINAEEKDDG